MFEKSNPALLVTFLSCTRTSEGQLHTASTGKDFCNSCWSFSSAPDGSRPHWSQHLLSFPIPTARRLGENSVVGSYETKYKWDLAQ